MGTVSVVIPAYNAERFIRHAIDSVLRQTVQPTEVLVVDDGSSDATAQTVSSYGGIVRLVTQANSGPARARNHGVDLATGEYIAFLDADDAWQRGKLEKQLAALASRPDAVLCYTGLTMVWPDGTERVSPAFPVGKVHRVLRVFNPKIPPSAVLIRRDTLLAVGGFDEQQKGCEDWNLWFRLSRNGPFCAVPDPVTLYTAGDTGLSSNADRMFLDFKRMLDTVLLRDLTGVRRAVWRRRILSYQMFTAALTARGAGEPDKEWSYFKRSALEWPSPLWYPERFKSMLVTLQRRLAA